MSKLLLILILFTSSFISCGKNEIKENTNSESKKVTDSVSKENVEHDLITVIGTGDIMMGTTYPFSDLPPDDGNGIFDGVKEILEDADVTMGNLEGTFLNSGGTPKECETPERCYSFRMPERYCVHLKNAGFDYMNLANNHSFDMGIKGRETTYEVLEKNEIEFAGTTDYPTAIIETKGLKIGFTGFAPNRGTLNINDNDLVETTIKELKSNCNLVFVMFHGGAEGGNAQNVTGKREYFLGEDRGNVYDFAHRVIDAGADLVIGSGPHVTRAVEIYKNRFIAYSLGNFCTYGKFFLSGVQGTAPIIKVYIKRNGEFIKAHVTSIKQVKRGFPIIDENESAMKSIVRLTNSNFGVNNVNFTENIITSRNQTSENY